MKESVEQFFRNNFTTTENEISELANYFEYKKVRKNEILLKSGDICRYLYFIINGCIKASFIASDGKETIRYVSFENQFISSVLSFIEQTPSTEFISACENSELLIISHIDFKHALKDIPLVKDFYIKMLEKAYIHNHWRIETFLSLDAKQRYQFLVENNKQLVQRLSNKDLSSFLGITQESLSRIKASK